RGHRGAEGGPRLLGWLLAARQVLGHGPRLIGVEGAKRESGRQLVDQLVAHLLAHCSVPPEPGAASVRRRLLRSLASPSRSLPLAVPTAMPLIPAISR